MSAGKTGNHLMISDSKLLASAAWDAQSLNELKAKAGEDPAANIRPVARQVEGDVRADDVEKHARRFARWPVQRRAHSPVYCSMYDQQIAQQMTAGKGLGPGRMMVKQMTPEQPLPEESTPAAPVSPARNHRGALSKSDAFAAGAKAYRNCDDSLPGDSKAFLTQLSLPPNWQKPAKWCATSFRSRSGGAAGVWLGTTANPP